MRALLLPLVFVLALTYPLAGQEAAPAAAATTLWSLERIDQVGEHAAMVLGEPRVIDTAIGKAIEFDGQDDGILLDVNPLQGLTQFTVEVIFRPAVDGPKEQRFVHFHENGTENRFLFEIRVIEGNRWFLDTFIKSGAGNYTQLAEKFPHPIGPWQHAAAVMDGQTMRHYVNGVEEMSTPVVYAAQGPGRTSLGARLNRVSWYRGAIRRIRVTPAVLTPDKFLKLQFSARQVN
jgi:hypothetical protein